MFNFSAGRVGSDSVVLGERGDCTVLCKDEPVFAAKSCDVAWAEECVDEDVAVGDVDLTFLLLLLLLLLLDSDSDESTGEMLRGLGSTPTKGEWLNFLVAGRRGLPAAEGFSLLARLSAYDRKASGVEKGG